MELHDYTITLPKRGKFSIIPLGDFHIGTEACDIEKLKEMIRWIRNTPNVYVLGMGDYIDAINLSDKRFDYDALTKNYKNKLNRLTQEQTDDCIQVFKPIKDRIIGLGVGNHELYIKKHYYYDPMYRICGVLNVRYLGWTNITRLHIVRKIKGTKDVTRVITIFAEHSRIAGHKKGGKINALEDRSNDFDCNIYFRGHSHDKICTTKTQLYVPRGGELRLREDKKVYAICPSYYNAYREGMISYAEEGGYSPTSTGVVRVDIEIKSDDTLDYHLYQ